MCTCSIHIRMQITPDASNIDAWVIEGKVCKPVYYSNACRVWASEASLWAWTSRVVLTQQFLLHVRTVRHLRADVYTVHLRAMYLLAASNKHFKSRTCRTLSLLPCACYLYFVPVFQVVQTIKVATTSAYNLRPYLQLIIRPYLEYAIQVWNLHLLKDIGSCAEVSPEGLYEEMELQLCWATCCK